MSDQKKKSVPPNKEGRLNVQIGAQKSELARAAKKLGVTQTQLLKDAIKTHLILLKYAQAGAVSLVAKDGKTVEVKL